MSLGKLLVTFDTPEDVDAGRLAAELEAAFETDVPGATATRERTGSSYQDLGTSLVITFAVEGAVAVAFKLLEKYLERKARNARLTIDLGEISPPLAVAIASSVDRKYLSPALAAEVDKHTKAAT